MSLIEGRVESTSASGQFLDSRSHEIRTALNGIVGMAQLLSDAKLNLEQQICVDTILQSSSGLLKTINEVLDISRLETGKMEISETTTDPHSICDRLVHAFRPIAQQKGLVLKCECQNNVPLSIMCDQALLERLIGSMLTAAIVNTHQGAVILSIECIRKSLKGAELAFHVIDTDSETNLGPLADALERSVSSDPASFLQLQSCLGMDLAVCKQLIGLMGGTLGVVCQPEKGCTLTATLTLRQANNPAPFNFSGMNNRKISRPNTRILIAEDNKLNQRAVLSILQKAGCVVEAVNNGEEAVQKCRAQQYDAILMDCQMPVMDGFEATTLIRALDGPSSKTPIIALTANAMKGDKLKCLEMGMDDYLSKPIERQDLIDTLNRRVRSN
ncbi:response regulator [Pontiellaceae bacterium B12227]|nr:response regulator [Pontiellaceae bacterium B12227]